MSFMDWFFNLFRTPRYIKNENEKEREWNESQLHNKLFTKNRVRESQYDDEEDEEDPVLIELYNSGQQDDLQYKKQLKSLFVEEQIINSNILELPIIPSIIINDYTQLYSYKSGSFYYRLFRKSDLTNYHDTTSTYYTKINLKLIIKCMKCIDEIKKIEKEKNQEIKRLTDFTNVIGEDYTIKEQEMKNTQRLLETGLLLLNNIIHDIEDKFENKIIDEKFTGIIILYKIYIKDIQKYIKFYKTYNTMFGGKTKNRKNRKNKTKYKKITI